jgi:hypothetical protein
MIDVRLRSVDAQALRERQDFASRAEADARAASSSISRNADIGGSGGI